MRQRLGAYRFPTELVTRLVGDALKGVRRVFIPGAERVEEAVRVLASAHPGVRFVLSPIAGGDAAALRGRFRRHRHVEVVGFDLFHPATFPPDVDLVFLTTALGLRSLDVPPSPRAGRYLDALAVEKVVEALRPGGRLIAIVSESFLFSARLQSLRRWLAEAATLLSIRALPERGLLPVTAIKVSAVEILKRRPDAAHRCAVMRYRTSRPLTLRTGFEGNPISEERQEIGAATLRRLATWSVDALLADRDADLLAYYRSDVPRATLAELGARISGGVMPRLEEVVDSLGHATHGLVQIRSIRDGGVDLGDIDFVHLTDTRRAARYEVRPGDLLMTCRGTALRLGIVPSSPKPLLISHNVLAIRTVPGYDVRLLKIFLESLVGRRLLEARQRGTTLVVFSPADLATLPVPVPPPAEQRRLALAAEHAEARARTMIARAEAERARVYEHIYNALGLAAALGPRGRGRPVR